MHVVCNTERQRECFVCAEYTYVRTYIDIWCVSGALGYDAVMWRSEQYEVKLWRGWRGACQVRDVYRFYKECIVYTPCVCILTRFVCMSIYSLRQETLMRNNAEACAHQHQQFGGLCIRSGCKMQFTRGSPWYRLFSESPSTVCLTNTSQWL